MPPFTAGSNISGTRPKYSVTIVTSVPVSGGTTDAITMPEMSALPDLVAIAEVGDEDAELVGRALADRRQPPAVHQRLAAKHADHDVRVADVNR